MFGIGIESAIGRESAMPRRQPTGVVQLELWSKVLHARAVLFLHRRFANLPLCGGLGVGVQVHVNRTCFLFRTILPELPDANTRDLQAIKQDEGLLFLHIKSLGSDDVGKHLVATPAPSCSARQPITIDDAHLTA